MKTTEINLDDIIFEHRNKDYGAYLLRKKYGKRLMSSLTSAIAIFLLGVSGIILADYLKKEKSNAENENISVQINNVPKEKIIPLLPEVPVQEKKVVAFRAPIVINTDEEIPEELSDIIEKTQNTSPIDTVVAIEIPEEVTKTTVIEEEEEKVKIYTVVEEWPQFQGGDTARIKYLSENLKYPKIAKETGIQGAVYVTFVIEKDGSISNVNIIRGIGGGCDEEALRVVSAMPKWKPGRQNGKEVRVQFSMPITFKLL